MSSHIHNIPTPNLTSFAGNKEGQLSNIYSKLKSEFEKGKIPPSLLIKGQIGVGKTRLIIEYCYKYSSYYSDIYWIKDSSIRAFKGNYVELLEDFDNKTDLETQVRKLRKYFNKYSAIALIVFDNVEFLPYIYNWVPQNRNIYVIFISSMQETKLSIESLNLEKLEVKPLSSFDASKLLCSQREDLSLQNPQVKEIAEKIVYRLDFLPLLINIAANSLGRRIDMSLSEYLKSLEEHGLFNSNLQKLSNPINLLIGETWDTLDDYCKELLQYISWCYPENIPLDWLKDAINWDKHKFNDTISRLYEINLILTWDVKQNTISTNFLINNAIRVNLLKNTEDTKEIKKQFDNLLKNIHPHFNPASNKNIKDNIKWIYHQKRYAQHAFSLLKYFQNEYIDDNNKKLIVQLYKKLGSYLNLTYMKKINGINFIPLKKETFSNIYYNEIIKFYDHIEKTLLELLVYDTNISNDTKIDIATIMDNYGILLKKMGQYNEAEKYLYKALEIREDILDKKAYDISASFNNIANLLCKMEKFDEAEDYYKQALEIRKEILGENHIDIGTIYNNMGLLLGQKNKYDEAKLLLEKAFNIYKSSLGINYLDTAQIMNNLAFILCHTKNYEASFNFHKQALEIREEFLSEEHPDTAESYINLGFLFSQHKKNYCQAYKYYKKALKSYEKSFGRKHINIAITKNNIAELIINIQSEKRYIQAESFLREALEIDKEILGDKHNNTIITLYNLGTILTLKKDYAEAEKYYKEILEIEKNCKKGLYFDVYVNTLNNLSKILRETNRYSEAEPFCIRSLQIYENEKRYGIKHSHTGISYFSLARVWYNMNKNKALVLELSKRAYAIFYFEFNEKHPYTITVLDFIKNILKIDNPILDIKPNFDWYLFSEKYFSYLSNSNNSDIS